jgi:hypothetical protein
MATSTRYQVSPIATEHCDAIDLENVILKTDDLVVAKQAAEHNSCPFGAGILDCQNGLLDVGFGFGVPCPSIME